MFIVLTMISKSLSVQVQFLREIGVQKDAIGDVLARFPRIFTYSLEKKIRPTVCLFFFLFPFLLTYVVSFEQHRTIS